MKIVGVLTACLWAGTVFAQQQQQQQQPQPQPMGQTGQQPVRSMARRFESLCPSRVSGSRCSMGNLRTITSSTSRAGRKYKAPDRRGPGWGQVKSVGIAAEDAVRSGLWCAI